MKPRRRAREAAFQFLYQREVHSEKSEPVPFSEKDLISYFEHFQVPENSREFAKKLVMGTLERMEELDLKIQEYAKNWKLSRMSLVDRSLLRLSVYELIQFDDIPVSVTLDETIELAKQFGSEDSASFLNGILDAVAKEVKKKPAKTTE